MIITASLFTFEPRHEIPNNVVCGTSKGSDQPAHTRSLIRAEYSMTVKLLTEHHLEFVSVTGCFTGSSESIYVKVPHCWKSHVTTHLSSILITHLFPCSES